MDKAVQLSKSWDMWPIVEGKKKIYIYIYIYISIYKNVKPNRKNETDRKKIRKNRIRNSKRKNSKTKKNRNRYRKKLKNFVDLLSL